MAGTAKPADRLKGRTTVDGVRTLYVGAYFPVALRQRLLDDARANFRDLGQQLHFIVTQYYAAQEQATNDEPVRP